jgi:transglutaminase-like putative cysteine protease
MDLRCESSREDDYLASTAILDYSHPLLQETLLHLASVPTTTEKERIRTTFVFVRDTISHSMDIGGERVTCVASDVLRHRQGLCFAKSHLLAALLRAQGIPTGLCYQRLLLGETADEGYSLHGLNAMYIASEHRWIRLDARGKKPGIETDFTGDEELLAYTVRPKLGEVDYPTIYANPHPSVVHALQEHDNCQILCASFLPAEL